MKPLISKRSMMPAWHQLVPISGHVEESETARKLQLYATSIKTSVSTRLSGQARGVASPQFRVGKGSTFLAFPHFFSNFHDFFLFLNQSSFFLHSNLPGGWLVQLGKNWEGPEYARMQNGLKLAVFIQPTSAIGKQHNTKVGSGMGLLLSQLYVGVPTRPGNILLSLYQLSPNYPLISQISRPYTIAYRTAPKFAQIRWFLH